MKMAAFWDVRWWLFVMPPPTNQATLKGESFRFFPAYLSRLTDFGMKCLKLLFFLGFLGFYFASKDARCRLPVLLHPFVHERLMNAEL